MSTLRFLTAGESHGPAEIAILEGMPAGVPVSHADIQKELEKRRGGAGRGGRGKIETDEVRILSGIRFGRTMGSPIALMVENKDFANWKGKMDIEDNPSIDMETIKATTPRPGHADLSGSMKYGTEDIRMILERASARETVMRVAIGAVCKQFLSQFSIEVASHTIQIGHIQSHLQEDLLQRSSQPPDFFSKVKAVYETDPDIRCIDPETSARMKEAIREATLQKNTLGGVVEIIAHGVPVGLGSHVQWDRKIGALLAQALMSIPSVKAVEIGDGVANASKRGSDVHDAIHASEGRLPFSRKTNRAGGIEGGISNGSDIVCRVYHKPISTLGNPLDTIDTRTKQTTKALIERSDICVVPRAGVISEAMVSFVLAQAFQEKFGGDSLMEVIRNFEGYINQLT